MQQPSGKLARHDCVAGARLAIHHLNGNSRSFDSVSQLRCEVPLDLFSAEIPNSGQQRFNDDLCPLFGEKALELKRGRLALAVENGRVVTFNWQEAEPAASG